MAARGVSAHPVLPVRPPRPLGAEASRARGLSATVGTHHALSLILRDLALHQFESRTPTGKQSRSVDGKRTSLDKATAESNIRGLRYRHITCQPGSWLTCSLVMSGWCSPGPRTPGVSTLPDSAVRLPGEPWTRPGT